MNPRNLTREAIEQLNDTEPYCFETDREEQWFNIGLRYGLNVADSDPISPWISTKEFRDSLLRELEEQSITPGTKVSVKTRKWNGDEIDTETYFFDVSLVWGKMTYVFHKTKKDGTMSQINQHIEGRTIISIRKI